ncbi:protein of unknown function (plasmid) [Cupriavidus neocaledonicus]|uniref:Uncharacterized protein n=1 Tax=Cupriavidus neocaledonicus TaxID=1040979 RepID=A0A375HQ79_9BURK|nr:hypothetical protein CBM2605_B100261 [Cupriavidus neocaledonicus]SPD60052.1 protein of unknown function [Cupriavidus neocaledonicus]
MGGAGAAGPVPGRGRAARFVRGARWVRLAPAGRRRHGAACDRAPAGRAGCRHPCHRRAGSGRCRRADPAAERGEGRPALAASRRCAGRQPAGRRTAQAVAAAWRGLCVGRRRGRGDEGGAPVPGHGTRHRQEAHPRVGLLEAWVVGGARDAGRLSNAGGTMYAGDVLP